MKKLSIISNQIKNNTFSYTGKGSFEAVVNNNKELILGWLEELIPLQSQIDLLHDLEGIEFQKRNYTRILTKVFPDEYKEFVSLNILVRDANIIAQYYSNEYNITILYDNLIKDKYLKYPGKYEKYVEFNIFQKFVMMYREDLITSLNTENQSVAKPAKIVTDEEELIADNSSNEKSINTQTIESNETSQKEDEILPQQNEQTQDAAIENSKAQDEKEAEEAEEERKSAKDKDTNWTQLLLGKLR